MTAVQTAAPQVLDALAARAGTDRLRLTLTDAHEQLIVLWAGRAHEALGYGPGRPGWAAYVAAEFGELLSVLPTAEQLGAMCDAGMSQREIAAPFGVSLGTVNRRLQARAGTAAAGPDLELSGAARVRQALKAAGRRGLTSTEAARRAKCSQGAASGELSRLWRTGGAGMAGAERGGYGVYVAPH